MATLAKFALEGLIEEIDPGLSYRDQKMRRVFVLPEVKQWLDDDLENLDPVFDHGRQAPSEQFDYIIYRFAKGDCFDDYKSLHVLNPTREDIWEIKTQDLRLIGWFPCMDAFIIAIIDSAYRIKEHDLYTGYLYEAKRKRDVLNMPCGWISGGYNDVLSG